MKLGHEGYWSFLKRCEDTGLERMADFVEKEKWIAKYEEQLALWKAQQGMSKSIFRARSVEANAFQMVMVHLHRQHQPLDLQILMVQHRTYMPQ
jgi:hypothetical protein